MSRLLCWLCLVPAPTDMGGALSHQDGEACDGAGLPAAPPTMADVIRERKKKAGGAGLGTLRRRLAAAAAAARRPRDHRPDRGCEHARYIRGVVSRWRLAEVFLLCEELEAGAALRDLVTQAELAREPAPALPAALARAYADRWWVDVELVGAGWALCAHRCVLVARSAYFRRLLARYPPGVCRVPLEGACAGVSRAELDACLCALYSGGAACPHHRPKWEFGASTEGDLDIISGDSSNCGCACGSVSGGLSALLGVSCDSLHHDMRYLLEAGEMSDCRLSWGGYELCAHRLVLAARSRYFRSVMSRRGGGGTASGVVCVDEKVLPRRFARALLHAAYTDQVDLSLIGRNSSSPSSTTTSSSSSAWAGGRGRATSTAALDDAFQLYEIARFLEMPIVVQGCEDAIVEALSPETLPHVVRWAAAPHASQWVHRQAMRYLRDEFPTVMASAASARLPRSALQAALASPFLQCSEADALRALLRWGERARATPPQEPNVVWHTAHSVSRRGRRRSVLRSGALREALGTLLPLVRTEHLPQDYEPMLQLVRRGVMPPPHPLPEDASPADAWLGRGSFRPARTFLPYLDEVKALLAQQAPPEAELARLRRARLQQRIPDTLYMVAANRSGSTSSSTAGNNSMNPEGICVEGRVLASLRARMRRLRNTASAVRAASAQHHDPTVVLTQIALRAVRELSLPDSCADLLLQDAATDREREWESPSERRRWDDTPPDCCRGGSAPRCVSASSARDLEGSRAGTLRRETTRADTTPHSRQSTSSSVGRASSAGGSSVSGGSSGGPSGGRLSSCVPDVAMAPNANTHLLAAPYCRPPPEYSSGVLQLDLGDGATHTPRPGSRAARALAAGRERRDPRELPPPAVYSSFQACVSAGANNAGARCRTLPAPARDVPAATHRPGGRTRLGAGAGALAFPHHAPLGRAGSGGGGAGPGGAGGPGGPPGGSPSPSPSPRRHALLQPPRDYRLDPPYGPPSRGGSPNNYA